MSNNSELITSVRETKVGTSLFVKHPSIRYFDEFTKLTCAPDLLANKLFPNSKEISESMAAYNAARRYMSKESLSDENIILLDIGCGHTPRTAALFAMRTKWKCFAIDPNLRKDKTYDNIDRLRLYPCKIEDYKCSSWTLKKTVVITAVHSHATLKECVSKARNASRVIIVAIPCCVPLELENVNPVLEYSDWGMWSEKRLIKIYDIRERTL